MLIQITNTTMVRGNQVLAKHESQIMPKIKALKWKIQDCKFKQIPTPQVETKYRSADGINQKTNPRG